MFNFILKNMVYKSKPPSKEQIDVRDWFNRHLKCPDCNSNDFYKGPSGGLSQNIICAECESRFNVCLVNGTFIQADRIV